MLAKAYRSPLKSPSALPGFGVTMTATLLYLGLIVLVPLGALVLKASRLGLGGILAIALDPRVFASLKITFGIATAAAVIDLAFGSLIAWTLTRYRFSRPPRVRRGDRSAVRPADSGGGHLAFDAVRAEWLVRRPAREARDQDRVHALGDIARAGVRRPTVRRPHVATDHRGTRDRTRGGLGDARRQPLFTPSAACCCRNSFRPR